MRCLLLLPVLTGLVSCISFPAAETALRERRMNQAIAERQAQRLADAREDQARRAASLPPGSAAPVVPGALLESETVPQTPAPEKSWNMFRRTPAAGTAQAPAPEKAPPLQKREGFRDPYFRP